MKLDNFMIKAQEALLEAQHLAEDNGNQEVYPTHLLSALLNQDEGVVSPILQQLELFYILQVHNNLIILTFWLYWLKVINKKLICKKLPLIKIVSLHMLKVD